MPHSGGDTLEAIERIGLMNIEDMETAARRRPPGAHPEPEVFEAVAP